MSALMEHNWPGTRETKHVRALLTWDELMAVAKAPKRSGNFRERSSEGTDRGKFYSLPSYTDAVTAMERGYPKGLEAISGTIDAIQTGAALNRIVYQRLDVAGDRPVVPLAAAGEPRSMIRRARHAPVARPTVSIVDNVICPSFCHEASLRNRGAAILAWALALETAGVGTEIRTVYAGGRPRGQSGARPNQEEAILTVLVKGFGEAFDIDRLSFALACPDFMRRINFMLLECCNGIPGMANGYGSCFDPLPEELPPDAVYIAAMMDERNYSTPALALKTVRERIIQGAPHLRHALESEQLARAV